MIIQLISSPRNVSTALMYSFAQRTDTKVMDEPFYGNYLNRFDTHHPGKQEIIESMECDFNKVIDLIDKSLTTNDHVFVKNMAHHLIDVPLDFLTEHRNIIFIRDPKEIITSFAKVIPNPNMQDIGVLQQSQLFDHLSQYCNYPPIVLDSKELIKDPKTLLTKLCKALEIPFQSNMLSWNKGGISEDGIWAKYWYSNVHNSTGFLPPSERNEPFPEHCQPLLEEALTYYESLTKHSLKA